MLVLHTNELCALFAPVFFPVKPPMVIFWFYHQGRPASRAVTARRKKECEQYNVQRNPPHVKGKAVTGPICLG